MKDKITQFFDAATPSPELHSRIEQSVKTNLPLQFPGQVTPRKAFQWQRIAVAMVCVALFVGAGFLALRHMGNGVTPATTSITPDTEAIMIYDIAASSLPNWEAAKINPGVTIGFEDGTLNAVVTNGEMEFALNDEYNLLHTVALADLNNDGVREICTVSSYGFGVISLHIRVLDIKNGFTYTLDDRMCHDFMLRVADDGTLYALAEPWHITDETEYVHTIYPLTLQNGELTLDGFDDTNCGVTHTIFDENTALDVKGLAPTALYDVNDTALSDFESITLSTGIIVSLNDNTIKFTDRKNTSYSEGHPFIYNIYLADLNGDAIPEVCFTHSDNNERTLISVYDINTDRVMEHKWYNLHALFSEYDAYLTLVDGALCVELTPYPQSDNSQPAAYQLKIDNGILIAEGSSIPIPDGGNNIEVISLTDSTQWQDDAITFWNPAITVTKSVETTLDTQFAERKSFTLKITDYNSETNLFTIEHVASSLYLADLNGDGVKELCVINSSNGSSLFTQITVYDLISQQHYIEVKQAQFDYALTVIDNVLHAQLSMSPLSSYSDADGTYTGQPYPLRLTDTGLVLVGFPE